MGERNQDSSVGDLRVEASGVALPISCSTAAPCAQHIAEKAVELMEIKRAEAAEKPEHALPGHEAR